MTIIMAITMTTIIALIMTIILTNILTILLTPPQVVAASLGKYCVRFGSDIKQFCSNVCLEDYKKGLKVRPGAIAITAILAITTITAIAITTILGTTIPLNPLRCAATVRRTSAPARGSWHP